MQVAIAAGPWLQVRCTRRGAEVTARCPYVCSRTPPTSAARLQLCSTRGHRRGVVGRRARRGQPRAEYFRFASATHGLQPSTISTPRRRAESPYLYSRRCCFSRRCPVAPAGSLTPRGVTTCIYLLQSVSRVPIVPTPGDVPGRQPAGHRAASVRPASCRSLSPHL